MEASKKRCIIIDDERLARVILRDMLTHLPDVALLSECANAAEAKVAIEKHRPDFILLDIKMPDKSGFELLEELDYIPQIIFTTAYDDHAIEAFRVNALDYLLKPIKEEDLTRAIQKIVSSAKEDLPPTLLPNQLFVKDGDQCHFIQVNDIILFESYGNYVKIHTADKTVLTNRSLNDIEKRTKPTQFFRANRTAIIHIQKIQDAQINGKGVVQVIMVDGKEVVLSERKSVRFKEMMEV